MQDGGMTLQQQQLAALQTYSQHIPLAGISVASSAPTAVTFRIRLATVCSTGTCDLQSCLFDYYFGYFLPLRGSFGLMHKHILYRENICLEEERGGGGCITAEKLILNQLSFFLSTI
jgi:hypothetical protein